MSRHRGHFPRRLRASESGLLGQGLRFALAGCIVAAVYLLTTTLLAAVVGLPFQAALAIGFCLALAVHFTLQRAFVWVVHGEDFVLPIRRQVGRYLLVTGSQYGITAASVALLPSLLGLSAEVVYLATVVLTTSSNFLIFRRGVFQATSTAAAGSAMAPVVKAA